MLKARYADRLILGLSAENIRRLRAREPIRFALAELGFTTELSVQIEAVGPGDSYVSRPQGLKLILLGYNDPALEWIMADHVSHLPAGVCRSLTGGVVETIDLFYGETEDAMYAWMQQEKLINSATRLIVDPRLGIDHEDTP